MIDSKCRHGFTLPELLLTAVILSYAVSVMLITFISSVALDEASRNLTRAVTHADYVLEDIRTSGFSGLAAGIAAGNWNWSAATITGKGLDVLNTETIAVTSSGSNPLNVTVTVNWRDLNNRSRSRALTTTISG